MKYRSRNRRSVEKLALAVMMSSALFEARAGDVALPPISIGAGVQADFQNQNAQAAGTTASVNRFNLDSMRLYMNGNVTNTAQMTFNTEYTTNNSVQVLDAIARFEYSDHLHIWAGRFLPPSDRANLYGPYYANDWFPYSDGVADPYPSVYDGRDNGVAYWGQFGRVKVSAGLFDGATATPQTATFAGNKKLLSAFRVMVDLWDPEPGYYLNGTYYGKKNILALGLAGQHQTSGAALGGTTGGTIYSLDGLLDRKIGNLGVVTLESEYERDTGILNHSHGWYALAAYLFPKRIGIGRIQALAKISDKNVSSGAVVPTAPARSKELDLNYVIDDFNERVGFYYLDQTLMATSLPSAKIYGIKVQYQMF